MAITSDKQNAALLRNIGSMQTSMSVVKALTDTTDELVALYPGLKKLKDLLTNYIPQWIKDLVVPTPKSGYGETVNTTTKQDALMINDGVIRFHPSDKFMRVNDSTMIAGTSVDGNKKLAKSISGGGDTSKLVQAIQAAFAGVHITVNVDPMKIDREIKFRTATINV
jgi:predicted membrane-bound spermidine synthase